MPAPGFGHEAGAETNQAAGRNNDPIRTQPVPSLAMLTIRPLRRPATG